MPKRSDPVSRFGPGVIVTARLPAICPSCAAKHPAAAASGIGTAVITLTCGRCAWSAKYELLEPEGA